jgi:hypothetical protein
MRIPLDLRLAAQLGIPLPGLCRCTLDVVSILAKFTFEKAKKRDGKQSPLGGEL